MKKFILLTLTIFSGAFNLFSQPANFVTTYDSMHLRFQVYYAFGEWKAIDWEALNDQIKPKIINAGLDNDTNAFYLALREYVASVPDGHVSVRGTGWEEHKAYARYQQIGGSYGFALSGLDDDRIAAVVRWTERHCGNLILLSLNEPDCHENYGCKTEHCSQDI